MAIIVGDIHGGSKKARMFLEYKPEVEHVILGDLMDSRDYGVTLDDELECLEHPLFQCSSYLGLSQYHHQQPARWRDACP